MPRDEEVHEPQNRYEAEEWLLKARQDLAGATALLSASPALPDVAVFHAQQAAEKSWKALLAWHGATFRKTHDLRELGQQLADLDPSLRELAILAEQLTPFAWVFRCPGETEQPTLDDARAALAVARKVFDAARRSTGLL
jgi:HEPN domain-containing protein